MGHFNSKIKKLDDSKSAIAGQTIQVESTITDLTSNYLSSLRLNNFYAECKSFNIDGYGEIIFKRPFNKVDYLLDSVNNFVITYKGDTVEIRKLKSENLQDNKGARFTLSEKGDYVPSVCAIVCQDCS